jgi:hypothetical protein
MRTRISIATRQGLTRMMLLCGVFAGCQIPVDFEGRDQGVFFPAFRATVQLEPSRQEQGEQPAKSGTLYLDLDVSGGSGRDSQTIAGTEFIRFDGTDFSGPATVTGDWGLILGAVSARAGWEIRKARIQGFVGLGLAHLDMEMSVPGNRAHDTSTSLGPYFGARAEYDALRWLSIYGQVSGMLGWGNGGPVDLAGFDIGVLGRPADRVGIFAAYRFWGYREDRSPSAIDLEMSGPVLGIQLDF